MSSITIKFDTDNAAFEEDFNGNVSWILKRLSDDADNGDLRDNGNIYDINGNRVGTYDVVED
jgi:hypothetical protein